MIHNDDRITFITSSTKLKTIIHSEQTASGGQEESVLHMGIS